MERNSVKKERRNGLSGEMLKIIALLLETMYTASTVLIKNGMLYGFNKEYFDLAVSGNEGSRLYGIYRILSFFGQFSFPIFLFLLSEGFLKTSDRRKYILRIFILALVSEVPYDLCFSNSFFDFSSQNPVWTLFLALITAVLMKRYKRDPLRKWTVCLLAAGTGFILRAQYGFFGVLLMGILLEFSREKTLRLGFGFLLTTLMVLPEQIFGGLSYILIYFYRGYRGRIGLKYFFYIYYPLHLTVCFLMIYIGAMGG